MTNRIDSVPETAYELAPINTEVFEGQVWPFFLASTQGLETRATNEEAAKLKESLAAVHDQIVQLCERA